MPYIHGVARQLPANYYKQEELISAFFDAWGDKFFNPQRLLDFQRNVLVGGRHLALPMQEYYDLDGFGANNQAWQEVALPIVTTCVQSLLDAADIAAGEVDILMSTTVTGISVPSLEARLMNQIPFRRDTKRVPLFGLGCLAGVAGINRMGDYLMGHPKEAGIFFSVELCSLTLQREDISIANIVASGLFGDGTAAVLMVGDEHPLRDSAAFEWHHPRSAFFPETERVMGWDVVDSGFKIVLSPDVPKHVTKEIPGEVKTLLNDANLEALDFCVAHPGGPKVLTALQEALNLRQSDLQKSWDSLAEYGNMSSTSVLFILYDTIGDMPPPNSTGLMAAMGPAFCAELNLIRTL